MKQLVFFPYGSNKTMLDGLINAHPSWKITPLFSYWLIIDSDHSTLDHYHQWILSHNGYGKTMVYHGVITIISAMVMIFITIAYPWISIPILLMASIGYTIVHHGISMYLWLSQYHLFSYRNSCFNVSLLILILSILALNGYGYYQWILAQSIVMATLGYDLIHFMHWFNHRYIANRYTTIQKIGNMNVQTKQDDGSFTNILAKDLSIDQEIVIKVGTMIPVDGIIVHGNTMVQPWYDKDHPYKASSCSLIYAGSNIIDGSATVKVVQPLSNSLYAKITETITSSFVCTSSPIDHLSLYILGLVIIGGIICCLFGFRPITLMALSTLFACSNSLYPLLNQKSVPWHRYSEHGILPTTSLDPTTLNNVDAVLMDAELLKQDDDLEVDQVWLTQGIDNTLFYHMVMHLVHHHHDKTIEALQTYIKNQNIKDTDLRLSQTIYKKGFDSIMDGSTIHYGNIHQCNDLDIDTSIIEEMDHKAISDGYTMRYLTKDRSIVAIFRFKHLIYPRYQQWIESFKKDSIQPILVSTNDDPLEYLVSIYGFDRCINDAMTIDTLIQRLQSESKQVIYIHGSNLDPTIANRVDLSIAYDTTTIHHNDDLYLKTKDPLACTALLDMIHDHHHRDHRHQRVIPWIMLFVSVITTIVIPSIGYLVDPTLIFILITIVEFVLLLDPLVKPFHVPALIDDHSQHLTIKIDGISDADHTKIITDLSDHDPTIRYQWHDQTTLQLDIRPDLSRYTICQWIRSNGYAPRLIHQKSGKS